ncbi:hypothetical protein D9M72_203280 [compost metagenome]
MIEGLGLVVGQVGHHRHHRAVGVEQLRIVHRGLLRAVIQHVLVTRDGQPLGVALVRSRSDLAHRVDQRDGGLHPRLLLQQPAQPIRLDQALVLEATFGRCLQHDREQVAGQRVVGGDVGVVEVVARVGPQLGRTGVQVADLQLQADGEAGHGQGAGRHKGDRRPAPSGEVIEPTPECAQAPAAHFLALMPQAAGSGALADADIGQQHRQQQQVGEDQHRHANTGGDRQILDDRDIDQHEHGETHGIGQERGEPGEEQAAKGVACGHQLMGAAPHVLHDAVHLLRAVGHADGEHQEGHQDGERVQRVARQRDQPQLPDHGDQRAADHQGGAAHTTGVGVDDEGGDRGGGGEVRHDLQQPVEQVADQLGEADHANPDRPAVLSFVPGPQLVLEHPGERVVVDGLAADRVFLQQRHKDHARLEVIAHQTADNAGAGDVHAQLFDAGGRAVVGIRHHRTALETLFGHFGPAHRRGP